MSSDIAVKVNSLSKCYHVYDQPRDRLKQSIYPRLQKLVGRPPRQYYREFWALKDVSFEIKKGETVGIIGRNGSGKSTLLQMICGTLAPTTGSVHTSGRIAALLELGSGFNPEFTGRENVYMNASVLGLSRGEIDARFDDIVAFAEVGDFIDQPVKTYSSGMYVRLAFAVIAHVDADILVIDEALAVGDAFFTQKCMRFLRKFMKHGTVIFVSHDTGAVINFCSRAIWLQKGRVEFSGTSKEAADRYLKALYESQQGESMSNIAEDTVGHETVSEHPRDMRLDFINTTSLRNDVEVFTFNSDASHFGKGGATIISVQLLDLNDRPLSWVVGGEDVQLIVRCQANTNLASPIVGFLVNDRLGQALFGDNTFVTYSQSPLQVAGDQVFVARFEFRMPILPVGDYSLTVAIAEGSQREHVQHHWIHEALIWRSHSSSVSTGLVGIPMRNVSMSAL